MPINLRTLIVCSVVAFVAFANGRWVNAEQWPQFRGGDSDGVAASAHPIRWGETENVRWKVDIPGEGWSCPVVWGERVFLTTAVAQSSEARPENYRSGGGRRRDDLTRLNYQLQVVCLDATTGEELWRQTAREGRPTIPRHSSNTYATETPVTDGEHVYVYFGMMGLYCYQLDGTPVWKKDLGSFETRAGWGTSSSPVLHDGKLFIQVDNEQRSFLTAIDTRSGDELWRVPRDEASQYSSPIVWKNPLRSEIIVGGTHYRSYDPQTGKLLWQLDMDKGRSSATALAVGDKLFVGTELRNRGGADDGGGYLFAIKPGGSGDITPPEDATESEFVAWKIARSGIQMASPAFCEGYLYLFERRSGMLHCVSAETGETAYRQRVPGARAFWSSPWVSGGHVFCSEASGTTHVFAAGGEFKIVASNEIDEQTWSSPAVADGALYLRTASKLYCIAGGE